MPSRLRRTDHYRSIGLLLQCIGGWTITPSSALPADGRGTTSNASRRGSPSMPAQTVSGLTKTTASNTERNRLYDQTKVS